MQSLVKEAQHNPSPIKLCHPFEEDKIETPADPQIKPLEPLALPPLELPNDFLKNPHQNKKAAKDLKNEQETYIGSSPHKLMAKAHSGAQSPDFELKRDTSSEEEQVGFDPPVRARAISFGVAKEIPCCEALFISRKMSIPSTILKNIDEDASSPTREKKVFRGQIEDAGLESCSVRHLIEPKPKRTSFRPNDPSQINNNMGFDLTASEVPQQHIPASTVREEPSSDSDGSNESNRQAEEEARRQVNQVEQGVGQEDQFEVNQDDAIIAEIIRRLYQILLKLAKFKFRRAIAVFLTAFSGSLLLWLIREEILTSIYPVFIVSYVFLTYHVIENIISTLSHDILSWKKVENLFQTFDLAIIFLFLILLNLDIAGLGIGTKWITIFSGLNAIAYFCQSTAPEQIKESQMAQRVFFSIQLFLFSGKLDEFMNWNWQVTICFVWILLAYIGLYFGFFAGTTVYAIVLSFLKRNLYQNVTRSTLIIGFLWSTLYSGLGVVVLCGFITFTFTIDHDNEVADAIVKYCLVVTEYLSALLLLFSALASSSVIDFLTKFNVEETYYEAHLNPPVQQNDVPRQIIKEKKDTYFVRLSSTYFSPLKKSYHVKGKSDFNKLKKAVKKARHIQFQRKPAHDDSVNHNLKQDESIVDYLKRGKQQLDQVFAQNLNRSQVGQTFDLENQMDLSLSHPPNERNFFSDRGRQKTICTTQGAQHSPTKLFLSEGANRDLYAERLPSNGDQADSLCYICCQKPSDAVFTGCGHGGICIDCAIEVAQTKGKCMECRKEVEKLVRINPDPKLKDIVKGYEIITISQTK